MTLPRKNSSFSSFSEPSSMLSKSISCMIFIICFSQAALDSRNCFCSSVKSVASKSELVKRIPLRGFLISWQIYANSFILAKHFFSCCLWTLRACCNSGLAICKMQKAPIIWPPIFTLLFAVKRTCTYFPFLSKKENGNLSVSCPPIALCNTIMNFVNAS
uniref:Uncharacterized protein MANES_03G205100 n=1 Tax=Rhizophora mucronata TaxID=61149 RepID=A0A2P2MH80_RHIMU